MFIPPEVFSIIASFLDVKSLCQFRLANKELFSVSLGLFRRLFKRICVVLGRKSLKTLLEVAESRYSEEVTELLVYVLSSNGSLERHRFPAYALDQDCIWESGLDLLWLKSAIEQFKSLRTVRIMDSLFGAAEYGYPLAYHLFPNRYILDMSMKYSREESLRHTVLVVLTAVSEAKVELGTFDILLGHSGPTWDDDFDLDSLDSDSSFIDGGYTSGLDLSELNLSPAYCMQIRPFMAKLQCLRLHAGFYPGSQQSTQLAEIVALASNLKRLDIWFDNPATPLFRSLAELDKDLPRLTELKIAGLVTDSARIQSLLQTLRGSLKRLTFCHIMLEEATYSINGWTDLLTSIATTLSLDSLRLHALGVHTHPDWRPLQTAQGGKVTAVFESDVRSNILLFVEELRVNMENDMLWITCSPNELDDCLRH